MIRGIIAVLVCFFSMTTFASVNEMPFGLTNTAQFACGKAVPTNDPKFCSSFKTVAICYCTAQGLPPMMCQDMNMLYARLVSVFGSLQKACEYQKETTTQDCMDNWKCYRSGGVDSQGRSCSSTQKAC